MPSNEFDRLMVLVFGAFNSVEQGGLSARHEKQKSILRPAEGRHEFRPILRSQSTGRAGADVNEPSRPTQPALNR